MDDSHRTLEQKALRNVRALVDKLQHDEARKKRQLRWLLLVVVAVGLVLAGLGISASLKPSAAAQGQQRACELNAWNARAGAFERDARQAHPGESAREIQDRLKRERPAVMAEVKAQCASAK